MSGAILLSAILSIAAYAGDDPAPSLPRPDFRAQSGLVLIPVTVTDLRNRTVTGLDRQTFRVFDGKIEQPVTHFSQEDAPLSVGIVFDSSGSMADKLAQSREAVAQFFRTANPEDEFFLVEFADRARLAVPFTRDSRQIHDRLQATQSAGRTALLDAVCLATQYMKSAKYSRRALLVISDGGDNDSRFTSAELRRLVRETDVWIYSIGLYERTVMLPEQEPSGQHLLAALALDTGGREFAVRDPRDLPETARQIGLELRNQYVLGFAPAGASSDGRYHRVQVKVAGKNLHVSARPGYFSPQ